MLTKSELDAIQAEYEAATQGDWEQKGRSVRVADSVSEEDTSAPNGFSGGICNCLGGGYGTGRNHPVNKQAEANAAFIARVHQHIPRLLAHIAELNACVADAGRFRYLETTVGPVEVECCEGTHQVWFTFNAGSQPLSAAIDAARASEAATTDAKGH